MGSNKETIMLGKTVAGYHGLVSELLFHDKEFRMLLQMNIERYEVSKFVLINMCATMWGRKEASPGLNLVEKFVAQFRLYNIEVESPYKTETSLSSFSRHPERSKCLSVGGTSRTY